MTSTRDTALIVRAGKERAESDLNFSLPAEQNELIKYGEWAESGPTPGMWPDPREPEASQAFWLVNFGDRIEIIFPYRTANMNEGIFQLFVFSSRKSERGDSGARHKEPNRTLGELE